MELQELTYEIKGSIYDVFKELGAGLYESIYEKALIIELTSRGLQVESQVQLPVFYKGEKLDLGYRLDLLVNEQVIIEIKSIEELHDVHKKQLLTYLKLSNKSVGYLVNFNTKKLVDRESLIRIVNGY